MDGQAKAPEKTEDDAGFLMLLPWVTVPAPVRIGAVRFVPLKTHDPSAVFGPRLGDTIRLMLSRYLDLHGKQLASCTAVLHGQGLRSWDIEALRETAWAAAGLLALAALSEQRFFEGSMSLHLNSGIFRPIEQGVTPGQDGISLFIARRGGALRVGGYGFKDVAFQMPLEGYKTECPPINARFVAALADAQKADSDVWRAISSSLPFFLLANAETAELRSDECTMLSAIAFERLLEPPPNAFKFSEAFARVWSGYGAVKVAGAKRVAPDNTNHADVQRDWFVHQKWAKELYETRSAIVHKGQNTDLTRNWTPWQHQVVAAFTYPRLIKLLLAALA